MRKLPFLAVLLLLMPMVSIGAGSEGVKLLDPEINLNDKSSLQRGGKLFINYCLSCHSASFMRYNRMALDVGFTDDQMKKEMMFTTDKVGNVMEIAMSPEDAALWFGTQPPDLSVISRSKGVDWLYSYLLAFYEDLNPSRPFGVNNIVFPDVGMPHVFLELQGTQRKREEHEVGSDIGNVLELVYPGTVSQDEYRSQVKDLITFLAYLGEPAKVQRQELGVWVLLFLAVFFVVSYLLKKEYWKNVH